MGIRQLQDKVNALQEAADAARERFEELVSKAEVEAKEEAKAKEETKESLEQLVDIQKLEHESVLMNKNTEITILKEECQRAEEAVKRQLNTQQLDCESAKQLIDIQKLEHESVLVNKNTEIAVLKEEYQRAKEAVSRELNIQKLECESVIMIKDEAIAELQEKCNRREESYDGLEKLCTRARTDLLHLRDQKKFLEGSLARSMQHIEDLKLSREAIEAESMIPKHAAANSTGYTSQMKGHSLPRGSVTGVGVQHVFDGICETTVPTVNVLEVSKPVEDIGSELDTLLAGIETQLEAGKCGIAPTSESLFNLSAKSW